MGLLQEQNCLEEDPAFPREEEQTCENETLNDNTDWVDMGEQETKDSEVIDQEVRRNSLIKVAKMKKSAGFLSKKTKEKVPKQTAWDRFSRTSSKVPHFMKQG